MTNDRYVKGDFNVICDICGFKYKGSQLRKQWDGIRACSGAGTNDCWSPRHPQLSVRGRADKQAPPWVRPEPDDVFISDGDPVTEDDL